MSPTNPSTEYAGDLTSDAAWTMLKDNPSAQLVDVRTTAEWSFVGVPDLSGVGREVHCVEWQSFPLMTVNADFVSQATETLRQAGAAPETPVLFLCRSGARSRAAAIAMTRAGFHHAYNIAGGFEGDMDQDHHRRNRNGWKASGLPWKQS